MKKKPKNPAAGGSPAKHQPRFGRFRDVESLFALKRGTTSNLIEDGLIRSVRLKIRGTGAKGVRLIDLDSVRDYLEREMAVQNGGALS